MISMPSPPFTGKDQGMFARPWTRGRRSWLCINYMVINDGWRTSYSKLCRRWCFIFNWHPVPPVFQCSTSLGILWRLCIVVLDCVVTHPMNLACCPIFSFNSFLMDFFDCSFYFFIFFCSIVVAANSYNSPQVLNRSNLNFHQVFGFWCSKWTMVLWPGDVFLLDNECHCDND